MIHLYATLSAFLATFRKDERGATAIEYGLIAAGISVLIMTVVATIGQDVLGLFNSITTGLNPT